jgi:ankyrin repeat protein
MRRLRKARRHRAHRVPPLPDRQRASIPLANRPAFAGRFFVALVLLGLTSSVVSDPLLPGEDANSKTPLMSAARQGDAAAVSRLISAGADVNASNAGGATALMFAALGGDPLVTSLLVRAGADTDKKAKLGWTALALDAGATPTVRDAYGWTPLMRAVDRRRADVVRLLLDTPGIDLDLRQEDGATALHIAAAAGNLEIVRLLVANGANPAATNRNGDTPARVATAAGRAEIAKYLERTETGSR